MTRTPTPRHYPTMKALAEQMEARSKDNQHIREGDVIILRHHNGGWIVPGGEITRRGHKARALARELNHLLQGGQA